MKVARSFSAINASRLILQQGGSRTSSESTEMEKWESTKKNRQKCKKGRTGTEERRKGSMGRCIMYKRVN